MNVKDLNKKISKYIFRSFFYAAYSDYYSIIWNGARQTKFVIEFIKR